MINQSNNNKRAKVFVAMSGGVDSSVVAGMMKDAGHDVVGVTMSPDTAGVADGACLPPNPVCVPGNERRRNVEPHGLTPVRRNPVPRNLKRFPG